MRGKYAYSNVNEAPASYLGQSRYVNREVPIERQACVATNGLRQDQGDGHVYAINVAVGDARTEFCGGGPR